MFVDLDTGLGHNDVDQAALLEQGSHRRHLIVARIGGKTKIEIDIFNRLGNLGDAADAAYIRDAGRREAGAGGSIFLLQPIISIT